MAVTQDRDVVRTERRFLWRLRHNTAAIDLAPANDRGFLKGKFKDRYGADCSIQKSSLATEDCIWLGCDHETVDPQGRPCGARMHLTQSMAADLIPLLQHFVDTGELKD